MEKQMIYFFILISSFVITQHNITTKEFVLFKNSSDTNIDVSQLFDIESNQYKIEVITVNDINYEIDRKNLIQFCDLDFDIYIKEKQTENEKEVLFKSSSKGKQQYVNIKRCDNKLSYSDVLYIDKNNFILDYDNKKHKNLSFELVLWISGNFKKGNDNSSIINDGILREWYDENNLYIEYNFKNGKKNGVQRRWFRNGQQEILYYYSNGVLDGHQKSWYENGQLKSEWNYLNDKQNGSNKEWYSNGQLKHHKIFKNGILVELIESYDSKGNLN